MHKIFNRIKPLLLFQSSNHESQLTSLADYVWLPVRFDGEMAYLDWHDEWRIEDYD